MGGGVEFGSANNVNELVFSSAVLLSSLDGATEDRTNTGIEAERNEGGGVAKSRRAERLSR